MEMTNRDLLKMTPYIIDYASNVYLEFLISKNNYQPSKKVKCRNNMQKRIIENKEQEHNICLEIPSPNINGLSYMWLEMIIDSWSYEKDNISWSCCNIYGSNDADIRTLSNGKVRTSVNTFSLSNLFLREHNDICDYLQDINSEWVDSELFVIAKKINIALIAKIQMTEWLPSFGKIVHNYMNLRKYDIDDWRELLSILSHYLGIFKMSDIFTECDIIRENVTSEYKYTYLINKTGLKPPETFSDLTHDIKKRHCLVLQYKNSLHDVDYATGCLLEDPDKCHIGKTMLTVLYQLTNTVMMRDHKFANSFDDTTSLNLCKKWIHETHMKKLLVKHFGYGEDIHRKKIFQPCIEKQKKPDNCI